MDARERTLVIVLSTHRCGSSLTTHILHRAGMSLGPFELSGAEVSNRHGHFEAIPIVSLNRRVQSLVYGFMDDLPASAEVLTRFCDTKGAWDESVHVPDDLLAEGQSLIRALVNSGHVSGFKDPRTVLTWPFWNRVLAEFPDVKVVPLSLSRSPHEIAMSLVSRRLGWIGYWTALDVIAVTLRRQLQVVDGWPQRPPTICFGSPSYLRFLETAVLDLELTWDTANVLDLFDRSCVHQSPASVNHEAQQFFEALCGAEACCPDPESSLLRQERDARMLEELRLGQWASNDQQIASLHEAALHAARCALDSETRMHEAESRRSEAELSQRETQAKLIDIQQRLIEAQERLNQQLYRNEQLQAQITKFEAHPLLGAAIRGRRQIRRMMDSMAAGPPSNGE